MTRDDYYNMAVASGLWQSKPIYDTALMAIDLMKFVEMVVAAEREACAKVCEELRDEYLENDTTIDADDFPWDALWKGAIAIRARGENP